MCHFGTGTHGPRHVCFQAGSEVITELPNHGVVARKRRDNHVTVCPYCAFIDSAGDSATFNGVRVLLEILEV